MFIAWLMFYANSFFKFILFIKIKIKIYFIYLWKA